MRTQWILHLTNSVLLTVGVAAALPAQSPRAIATSADSVILQRSGCFGSCSAYRLGIRADGFVWFVSHNPGDGGRTESRTSDTRVMQRIGRELDRAQFFTLPAISMGKRPYCRVVQTDAPTISVTVFTKDTVRAVAYYMGCVGESVNDQAARPFLTTLLQVADSIDAIAAGKGWIRPAR